MKEIALPKDKEDIKRISSNRLRVTCDYDFDDALDYASCSIRNPNNYEIEDLEVCSTFECVTLDLKLNFTMN